MEIFDSYVFRRCFGWKDVSGDIHMGSTHEEHFLIQPAEHLMPGTVPRKARCKSCEIEVRRYQTLIRVRRYRIQGKKKEVLRNYVKAYQASQRGEISLPPNLIKQLRRAIIENGGELGDPQS